MTWVATGIAIATAVLGAYQADRVADKNDAIATQGIQTQRRNQRDVDTRVNRIIDDTAASDAMGNKAANDANFMAAINRGQQRARKGLQAGGVSQEFDALAGQSAANAFDYAGTISDLMSRIDAGGQQRMDERNAFGGLGMDLDVLGRGIQGDQFLTDLALKGVRRNPWIDGAVAAGNAYSSAGKG
jgi:hypothetical protein